MSHYPRHHPSPWSDPDRPGRRTPYLSSLDRLYRLIDRRPPPRKRTPKDTPNVAAAPTCSLQIHTFGLDETKDTHFGTGGLRESNVGTTPKALSMPELHRSFRACFVAAGLALDDVPSDPDAEKDVRRSLLRAQVLAAEMITRCDKSGIIQINFRRSTIEELAAGAEAV